jgi:hypothetical protein
MILELAARIEPQSPHYECGVLLCPPRQQCRFALHGSLLIELRCDSRELNRHSPWRRSFLPRD